MVISRFKLPVMLCALVLFLSLLGTKTTTCAAASATGTAATVSSFFVHDKELLGT